MEKSWKTHGVTARCLWQAQCQQTRFPLGAHCCSTPASSLPAGAGLPVAPRTEQGPLLGATGPPTWMDLTWGGGGPEPRQGPVHDGTRCPDHLLPQLHAIF